MKNNNTTNFLFRHYHRVTGYDRHAMTPHALDWESQPSPYKIYPDLKNNVELGDIPELTDKDLQMIVSAVMQENQPETVPDLEQLSAICFLANGLTGRARHGNSHFYYRSSPSAGALYPNELYLAWFDNDSLEPGIYHVGTYNRRLTCLRTGNFLSLFQASESEAFKNVSGIFLISGIFFRSAWKYRNRAYRYLLLDGGHLVESTRLAVASTGFSATICYDFDDALLNRLIGIDGKREGCLALIGISGKSVASHFPASTAISDTLPEAIIHASQVSDKEIVYEDIRKIHEESSLYRPPSSEKTIIGPTDLGLETGLSHPIETTFKDGGSDSFRMPYSEAVIRRRSKRNFIPAALSFSQFSTLLEMICHGTCPKFGHEYPASVSRTIQTGFLCRNVEGVTSGFYLIDPVSRKFSLSNPSDLISPLTDACLNQEWLNHAALHILFMTNLKAIETHLGARGYRYAMMTAGRLGHVVYLAATAMGLGCCGIGAFYDMEAERLLGLNETSTLLYLLAVGSLQK